MIKKIIKFIYRKLPISLSKKERLKHAVYKRLGHRINNLSGVSYDRYVEKIDSLSVEDRKDLLAHIQSFKCTPTISILMPTYNTNPVYLKKAIESILNQIYTKWELCIADDASTNKETLDIIKYFEKLDNRIRVCYRNTNGHISDSSNTALDLCTGEFTLLMDHDDLLPLHSVYMVVNEINQNAGEVDLIYSDEDKIDENDYRYDPYFKTDWNPTLLLSQNFVAHLGVYRTSVLKAIGGFRVGFEGSQDYDMLLRFVKKTTSSRIKHIPMILYHWRNFEGNKTFSSLNHDVSDNAAKKALIEYLDSSNIGPYELLPIKTFPGVWRVKRALPLNLPKVSIIIPTRDKLDLLEKCVAGLLNNTSYENIEIIIVDNGSVEDKTLLYFENIKKENNVKVIRVDEPFNFSRLNNIGVREATGELLCFLNNDIEVISNDWLSEMVSQILPEEVGVVGAKLLYENGNIQHSGVILGIYGVACHSNRHQPGNSTKFFGHSQLLRNVSAVTGACLLAKKDIFLKVGGFDEEKFQVGFNDVDLCLKIRALDKYIIYDPYAVLYHKESASRGDDDNLEKRLRHEREARGMIEKYGSLLKNDPFYNLNLSLDDEDYNIAEYSRRVVPWRDWIEFVCPFHRGDVILAIQICFLATKLGKKIRLHVSQDICEWTKDFNCNFRVESIPFGIPQNTDNMNTIRNMLNYVASRDNFSRKLAVSHKLFDFKTIGLDIVDHLLYECEIPLNSKLDNIDCIIEDTSKYSFDSQTIFIHPNGGWNLKSVPAHIMKNIIQLLHKYNFKIVQIGGKNDLLFDGVDSHILENYSPKQWQNILRSGAGLICVDSWMSHFAAILDINHMVLYGSTHPRHVNSRHHFAKQAAKFAIINPSVDCSPCNRLVCLRYNEPYCKGFENNEQNIEKFIASLVKI